MLPPMIDVLVLLLGKSHREEGWLLLQLLSLLFIIIYFIFKFQVLRSQAVCHELGFLSFALALLRLTTIDKLGLGKQGSRLLDHLLHAESRCVYSP